MLYITKKIALVEQFLKFDFTFMAMAQKVDKSKWQRKTEEIISALVVYLAPQDNILRGVFSCSGTANWN